MATIQLENVKKSFEGLTVLKNINLEIADGEFIVFVGPSGCGKSTLLRTIAGLEDIDSGRILLDGKDVSQDLPSERKLSMVFQSYALYPHMNVRENMGFSLKVAKQPKSKIAESVERAAEILQLKDYLDRKPKELSGGQRQRVAIGRAIVREPQGFLFDEPLSNLDASLRVEMRLEIARLHHTLKSTMIYVTHDQVEAMTLAQKIVVLKDGQIEQVGTPKELYQFPQNIFVAQFIGSPKMNILRVDASNEYLISWYESKIKKLLQKREEIRFLGVRPEHLMIEKKGGGKYSSQINSIEYLGSDTYIYTSSPNQEPITIRTDIDGGFQNGEDLYLSFNLKHLHFFDEAQNRVN